MTPALSANTQAILLMTAPLIAGRGASSSDLLSPGEYKRLARHLRELKCQPADLVSPDASDLLQACQPVIDEARLGRLLGRGFLLSQVIERWQARAIWVVSRADATYPRRLKSRLREDAPAVIYGCGNMSLLESGGLAMVGSRHVDDSLIEYTMAIGRLAASAEKTVISGCAKGIDQAAMQGALEAGGKATGVLADSLEKITMNREHRNLLLDGQLVLISPYDPSAGFNVGNAMQRNKLIYALADVSLVVNSDLKKGGTWAGAIEQLERLKYVPVYVRSTGESSDGLDALRSKGAISWSNPLNVEEFQRVFALSTQNSIASPLPIIDLFSRGALSDVEPTQQDLPGNSAISRAPIDSKPFISEAVSAKSNTTSLMTKTKSTSANTLFAAVRELIRLQLKTPVKDVEVAAELNISTAQAKLWLQRLVDEGVIERRKRPATYIVKQSGLFE